MIKISKSITLKRNQTLWLPIWGDIHYDTDECDTERFHSAVAWAESRLSAGDLVFALGAGDYNDFMSPSEEASEFTSNKGYGKHETTLRTFDRLAKKITDDFHNATKAIPWLGLCKGHHQKEFRASDNPLRGKDTNQYLCDLKGCTYFGTLGVVELFINKRHLRLVITHGYGGARTAGARVIKRVRMAEVVGPSCDTIYVMGHDDELMAKGSQVLDFDPKGRFEAQGIYFVGSGSFQRAYKLGQPTGDYVEQLMLPPAQLGNPIVAINFDNLLPNSWWHIILPGGRFIYAGKH